MMTDTEQEQDGNDTKQTGLDLRWEGHILQGHNIALNQMHDDAIVKLESRSDSEAREVLLGLTKELQGMNGNLAAHLAQMSNSNLGFVAMLRFSEDGRAALMMRRAADLLVKGLANAEEEVHALKAALKETEGQRDNYKFLLAKTNSELKSANAYAQMRLAARQAPAASAATFESAAALVDSSVLRPPVKRRRQDRTGKACAEHEQRSSESGVIRSSARVQATGSSSGGSADSNVAAGASSSTQKGKGSSSGSEQRKKRSKKGRAPAATTDTADTNSSSQKSNGSGSSLEHRKKNSKIEGAPAVTAAATNSTRISIPGTAAWRKDKHSRATTNSANSASTATTATVRARSSRTSRTDKATNSGRADARQDRAESVAILSAEDADGGRTDVDEDFVEEIEQPRLEEIGGSQGVLEIKVGEVDVPVSEQGPGDWAEAWNGGGDDGDDCEVQSVYDSDDAPSMFF